MTKTMIRIEKNSKNPYTMINNTLLHDKSLSWKAKGILAYLLSLPDDWKVYESEIVNHASDGIDSLRSGMAELVEKNYIHRTRERNEKGHLKGYKYSIYEIPTKNGLSKVGKTKNGKPKNGLSKVGKSNTTNTNSTNTNLTNTNNTKEVVEEGDNDNFKKIRQAFEQNGLGTISSYIAQELMSLSEEYTGDWLIDAIHLSVERNQRNLGYVKGILKSWAANGKDDGVGGKDNDGNRKGSGGSNTKNEKEDKFGNIEGVTYL